MGFRVRSMSLRWRLIVALVGVAVLAVALAMLFSNLGIDARIEAAAHERLERSARHFAEIALTLSGPDGWSPADVVLLSHLAQVDDLRVSLTDREGRPVLTTIAGGMAEESVVRTEVRNGSQLLGTLTVAPGSGELLSPSDRTLHQALDVLHGVAGVVAALVALAVALILAISLTRPLQRVAAAAGRLQRGDLSVRIGAVSEPEIHQVAQALDSLAENLGHEEDVRRENVTDLAHELRTPVTGLLARIEAVQDGVLPADVENLAAMRREVERLVRLVDDLSRLAEAQRPAMFLEKRELNLAEVALGVAQEFAASVEERRLRFTSDLQPVQVSGDRGRLEQIMVNLLGNACRYTPEGGEVTLRTFRRDSFAVVEVSDTGIGIAAEDVPHLFERFWRGDPSRSADTGGTGVGLTIVAELARAHGGSVQVASVARGGTTFSVTLPALESPH